MLEVLDKIRRAAQVDSPVSIWGEEGTGKVQIAETIHRQSRRAAGPFVVMRAGRLPEEFAEAAWSGTSAGLVEPSAGDCANHMMAAQGGTLLIQEITRIPRTCQAKILEAAEGRRGGAPAHSGKQRADLRVMATSRYELWESVERGVVREDLYYRLAVVTIRVPPLRERKEDIPFLVRDTLTELCGERDKPVPAIEPELIRYLVEQPWPGNLPRLRHCLDAMLGDGDTAVLGMADLRASLSRADEDSPSSVSAGRIDTLADLERDAVMRALEVCQGNRTKAAEALGISVRTLQRKLKQWGV